VLLFKDFSTALQPDLFSTISTALQPSLEMSDALAGMLYEGHSHDVTQLACTIT